MWKAKEGLRKKRREVIDLREAVAVLSDTVISSAAAGRVGRCGLVESEGAKWLLTSPAAVHQGRV